METIETSAMRKVTRRFMPLLFISFVAAFLDRVNVGFAALTMNQELGLSSSVFGLGAGLFFLTYFIFEVPSNLALERFGARRWITRIMMTWGLIAGAMAFIQGPTSFYVLRLLLGAAEAGFGPGIMFFLTLWFPAGYRARALGYFFVAMPFASVIGAPISGLLVSIDGFMGLKGWQLMFLVEALPTIILGAVVWYRLTDRPADADWLSEREKQWLMTTLATEKQQHGATNPRHGSALANPYAWALGLIFFGIAGLNYGMSFFLPQIIHAFNFSLRMTGLIGAVPFLFASVCMIWWGKRSDAREERLMHTLLPQILAISGLAISTVVAIPLMKLALITIACGGIFSAIVVFWAFATGHLAPSQAAAGVALINCVGNLSGFVDPLLIGKIKDLTGSYDGGLQTLAGIGAVAAFALGALAYGSRRRTPSSPAYD
ncbi:MFS transporter [Paraburkholderia sp. Tr-20389]|uniref:MFS transporter n=1 Tax=Paraburkholderia sp. Tr-20389 TaxID=2703903 RepID=UPI00197E7BFA|nr:MFS transporter [Paraburkholderia sp. Tr-20389]MBN3754357.1 MFS transporter [Paraburkholderia sp. Tr-20389]